VEAELATGVTTMARDMTWLMTSGQFFLHEIMHTRIANGKDEPHIIDEWVVRPDGNSAKGDHVAYGAKWVHKLAQFKLNQGGGAKRASTNADSYAMLANSAWSVNKCLAFQRDANVVPRWWDTTSYFPQAPDKPIDTSSNNGVDLIFPQIVFPNGTDPSTVNFNDLFSTALAGYGNIDEVANGDDASPSQEVSISEPVAAPAPPPGPSPEPSPQSPEASPSLPENICGSWYATTSAAIAACIDSPVCRYKVLFNHFEIYGKNFDPGMIGEDGLALREEIKGKRNCCCCKMLWTELTSCARLRKTHQVGVRKTSR
jgi:hypothetical protein